MADSLDAGEVEEEEKRQSDDGEKLGQRTD
jgi:hypothetical protein